MAPMRLTALLLSSCLLAAVPSWASTAQKADCSGSTYAYLNLSVQNGQPEGTCLWRLSNVPGLLLVDVVMYSAPASTVHLTLPDPPFGAYSGEVWNFPSTGNRTSGLDLNLGCSGGGSVVLGTILVTFTGQYTACTPWAVGNAEVKDCDGNVQPTMALTFNFASFGEFCDDCFQFCELLPPYGLHPVNGATNVPLDAELSFDEPVFQFVDENLQCSIRIGTSPDCSDAQTILVPCDTRSIVLDFLEASTTYYWRAAWLELAGSGCSNQQGGLSPVHSFTTGVPIAAEKTTWGHVKAMYRD